MTSGERLLPINREWVAPSLIWGEVAICRDSLGVLWFCQCRDESEGWQTLSVATADVIRGFQRTQELAGKEPQPWPEGSYTP